MSLFTGLITCQLCKRKHKKIQRRDGEKVSYICSHYNRNSSNCSRGKVDESQLLWLVSGHFWNQGITEENITREFIEKNVKEVLVNEDKSILEIKYKDGTNSLISPTTIIR